MELTLPFFLFWMKKLVSALVLPPLLPFILIFVGLICIWRRRRGGLVFVWVGFVTGVLIVTPPVVDGILTPLEPAMPLQIDEIGNAQAIVILGGGILSQSPEYGGDTVNSLTLERLRYGARLARKIDLPVLVSGGAPLRRTPEATLMKAALEEDFQIPVKWTEPNSLDTRENARNSAELLKPLGIEHIILVTHAAHMKRARAEFESQGFTVTAAPTVWLSRHSKDNLLPLPNQNSSNAGWYALHEWLGLAAATTFDPWWLAYPLLGVVVGFLAGLLGVGGGGVMVPVLAALFLAQGFGHEQMMHMALGTSMATIMLTSVSSLRAHHAHGAVRWDIVQNITPGILVGTFLGTFIASRLNTVPLTVFFACFMTLVAAQMLSNIKPKPSRELPNRLGINGAGLGIGTVSALVAIGGGSLSVPFMIWCNIKAQHAIGTSAAIGFPIALAGTVGYLVNGWGVENTPPFTLGYIYLPALLLTGVVSVFTAPFGAACAHRLPVPTLKKVFAGVLILLIIQMLFKAFR
jgi:uncharacterized membrane protein YfcA